IDAHLLKQEEKPFLEDMMVKKMQRIDAFLQEQESPIRNLEHHVGHLATIINHPEGTFQNNTDLTLEEKYCSITIYSCLYDDMSMFELQEEERGTRNATMQRDVGQHVNNNTISYEENPILR
ncbi:hypothetical protein PanWU01x14_020050, partial [Parasponia andersonii]